MFSTIINLTKTHAHPNYTQTTLHYTQIREGTYSTKKDQLGFSVSFRTKTPKNLHISHKDTLLSS